MSLIKADKPTSTALDGGHAELIIDETARSSSGNWTTSGKVRLAFLTGADPHAFEMLIPFKNAINQADALSQASDVLKRVGKNMTELAALFETPGT